MKISISVLQEHNYVEYKNTKNRMKYYLTSFRKIIDDIVIDITVLKSIRGGILFVVKYYYMDIEIYNINTKEANIINIEEVASIIKNTLDKIIEEEINKNIS